VTAETVGTDCQAACLVDGPVDDYESWSEDLPGKYKSAMYVHDLWILQDGTRLMPCPENTRPKPILLRAVK